MKGRFRFAVNSKRISYEFTLNHNVTIIKGNSGPGKTSVCGKYIYNTYYQANNKTLAANTNANNYFVYLRAAVGR